MGELRTRKRGKTWEWSFEMAKVNGKRTSKSKGGYRTKAEALAAGTKAKSEYDCAGRTFTPSNVSLADYLDYWLENHVKKNLSYNTYCDYESKVRIHIKPTLGMYRLCSIEPDVIQQWIDNIKIKGYSVSMVKNLLTCLSGAFNYAIMPLKYITYNPCQYVKLTRLTEDPERKKKREYICSLKDWNSIISRFPEESNYYAPLMVGYHLGTRIGETYAIDLNNDVDFKNNIIHIRRQLQNEHKQWIVKPPKYESYRTIEMGSTLSHALKKELAKRKETMFRYGPYYTKTYITPDNKIIQLPASVETTYKEFFPLSVKENGELMTPDSFKYCARVIHYELNIPLFHSHSLRHTHGTILAENGVNPKTITERLGHKDVSVTLKRYIFNTKKMRFDAVQAFEEAIC